MKRKKRTELLIEYGRQESFEMAEQIRKVYKIDYISYPKQVLVMVKVRESAKNSLFYLGEVLATETKVRIQNKVGLGLVKGTEDKWSEDLAIIDAAYTAKIPEVKRWEPIFERLEQRKVKKEQELKRFLQPTKVEFDMMN